MAVPSQEELRQAQLHAQDDAGVACIGCTRLELGLQSIYEDVARDTNRGHTIESAKGCFQLAKDAGFKVRRASPPAT